MHKVLLVDPNRQTRAKNRELLDWNRLGFVLEDDAVETMSISEIDRYTLVLIHMEGAESYGMKLCDRIREGSRVPIVLMGGKNDFELARKAIYYQVSDYLPSPVSAEELTACLLSVKRRLAIEGAADSKALPSPPSALGALPSASLSIIEKVKEYVDVALHQNITLKEISNILHFNCSYLGQKFKIHEKMTFNEYLLRQRMERAKYLLEHTDMKVYEIANEVGYSEMDWFYKKFKAYTGVSANEYRKMISFTA
ncbi:hypothetical protein PACILC2_30810 [Paenibacillus cisolokensis]|uniref:AraC family transcriptional regulator n=1 Tax=Paenibacillus cisolokensis TaxID=1658519 RepID=A0ABQ4N8I2_9BACL|nr:helix-turn-helix domain-containing protein [Paenibacillus cisolokensis]GIQ64513.1 hypothetical protein PACILC2_30810 [Paenibacillus cisolokensis]